MDIQGRVTAVRWIGTSTSGYAVVEVGEFSGGFQTGTITLPRTGPLANAQAGDVVVFGETWELQPRETPVSAQASGGDA